LGSHPGAVEALQQAWLAGMLVPQAIPARLELGRAPGSGVEVAQVGQQRDGPVVVRRAFRIPIATDPLGKAACATRTVSTGIVPGQSYCRDTLSPP